MNARICLALVSACILAGCDTRTEQPADATRSGSPRTTETAPAGPSGSGANSDRSSGSNTNRDMSTPGGTARDASPTSSTPMLIGDDARILSLMSAKDQEEVKVGKLAQTKATSAAAKSYADMLVKDHSDHADQVAAIAKAANISMVTPAPQGEDPAVTLGNLSGADFDRKFGELMTKGHQDLINQLQSAQTNLKNSEVRALVDKTLPVLRHHLEMAQAISGATGTPGSPATPGDTNPNPPVTPPANPNPSNPNPSNPSTPPQNP